MAKIKLTETSPIIAICYDFDKTLSPDDMQAQGYIQSVGYSVEDFWKESNQLAKDNGMDENLAYMFKMMQEAEGNFVFNKNALKEYGSKVSLFKGVEDWFDRINKYGEEHGVIIEHYIISSGLKEMIEGTSIAEHFKMIYASAFYYNDRGVAEWPAQAVNYTNKTQFLFRIEKGALELDDRSVNDYYPPSEIRIPFRNMIYIGDSDTDVPCMKLVNTYGGHSIGVYNPKTKDKSKVYKMIRDNRIKYYAPADYSENSEIDSLVKRIINKTAENEKLEQLYYDCQHESEKYYDSLSEDDAHKEELINQLDESRYFETTHAVVKELRKFKTWTQKQIDRLLSIAIENHPVRFIINDKDIKRFYVGILSQSNNKSLNRKVEDLLK